jgi:hypothetical protein
LLSHLVFRPQSLNSLYLKSNPSFPFGEVRRPPAVLAGPERHAVGLAERVQDVSERPLLLALVGDALGDGLDGEDVGGLDLRELPGMVWLRPWL